MRAVATPSSTRRWLLLTPIDLRCGNMDPLLVTVSIGCVDDYGGYKTFSEMAGQRAAAIMSLLATAKHNGRDTRAWPTDILTRQTTSSVRDIQALPPHRWQPARIP